MGPRVKLSMNEVMNDINNFLDEEDIEDNNDFEELYDEEGNIYSFFHGSSYGF